MQTTEPIQATVDNLKRWIPLARSPHLFLSAYLPTSRDDTTMDGIRLRLAARLEGIALDLADTPWAKPFLEERQAVESFMRSLRPGGRALALLGSRQAGEWSALWLPGPVPEQVHFGRGAYVLPLLDILDEWEPVGLVEVHKDKARVMVFAAGRIEEAHRFEAEVPGKHKAGEGYTARYQRGALGHAEQHPAGGGASARYQRHIETHAEQHLKEVARELQEAHHRFNFRRLFLAGPPEAVALFKPQLSQGLEAELAGNLSLSPRATDTEIWAQVAQATREVRRREEQAQVREVITRAEKGQGAVAGLAPTLAAVNERRVHLLVMAAGDEQPGRYCQSCQLVLPPEEIFCPRCDRKTLAADLRKEVPSLALAQGIRLELVHGEAASELWTYDGLAALLKPPSTR